jgi:hypothetical protein
MWGACIGQVHTAAPRELATYKLELAGVQEVVVKKIVYNDRIIAIKLQA